MLHACLLGNFKTATKSLLIEEKNRGEEKTTNKQKTAAAAAAAGVQCGRSGWTEKETNKKMLKVYISFS